MNDLEGMDCIRTYSDELRCMMKEDGILVFSYAFNHSILRVVATVRLYSDVFLPRCVPVWDHRPAVRIVLAVLPQILARLSTLSRIALGHVADVHG